MWPQEHKKTNLMPPQSLKFSHKAEAQKHILSVAPLYHLIYTESSRHKTAPTEKEGWRYLLEALRTGASGDVFCQVN